MMFAVLVTVLLYFIVVSQAEKPKNSVDFKMHNNAGKPVELFWVDTFSPVERLVAQSKKPIRNNTDATIHSYNGHKFMVRFLKHVPGTEVNFTKGDMDELITVTFDTTQNKLVLDQRPQYDEGITIVREAVAECERQFPNNPHPCISERVLHFAKIYSQQRDHYRHHRGVLGEKNSFYSCQDDSLNTTEPLKSHDYFFQNHVYNVDTLLDNRNAKIWLVDNFITEEECQFLEEYAAPRLTRATVAAADGTSTVSEHRKAQQAAYDLPEDNMENDPLWPLYDRILNLVNHHAHYSLLPEGQEGFTVIQYNEGDEYLPHCDGACEGDYHIKTARVATAVMYCGTAGTGGATVFGQADIFIRAQPGQAVIFAYKDPVTGRMDEGLTEHSGCPVREGEKWIAALWLREGVSREKPARDFDPTGYPILYEESKGAGNDAEGQEGGGKSEEPTETPRVAKKRQAKKEAKQQKSKFFMDDDEEDEDSEQERDEL